MDALKKSVLGPMEKEGTIFFTYYEQDTKYSFLHLYLSYVVFSVGLPFYLVLDLPI